MSDLIRLEHGHQPWHPTDGSSLFRTFDEYDIPLGGVIVQDNCLYLFTCVSGAMGPLGVWVYSHIEAGHLAALEAASGDDFDQLVLSLHGSRPMSLAVSTDDDGIVASVDLYHVADLSHALDTLKRDLERSIDRLIETRSRFEQLGASPAFERMAKAG